MIWDKPIRKSLYKDYTVTLSFYFSKGGVFREKYAITEVDSDIFAILIAKEKFYRDLTDDNSKPIPDGKLEINCIERGAN